MTTRMYGLRWQDAGLPECAGGHPERGPNDQIVNDAPKRSRRSRAITYALAGSDLVIRDGRGVRWRGQPLGFPVTRIIEVPGDSDAIALLGLIRGYPSPRFANLVRVDRNGRVVWRALPPTKDDVDARLAAWVTDGDDHWVACRWERRRGLSANSFSCFNCQLDAEPGRITSAEFTK